MKKIVVNPVNKANKKHVSRKLKSSWRKHIDTTDVDNFLEEKRQDERVGNLADKPSVELFMEEKKPGRPKATLREQRKKKFSEMPISLMPLKNASNVRDPIVKRNVKITNTVVVGHRPTPRLRKRTRPTAVGEAGRKDLWASDDETLPEELRSQWLPKEQLLHTLTNVGKPKVKLPGKMDTADKIAAQTKPLPREGTSYNPAIDDYIELKNEVVDEERKLLKRKAHFDRVVTNVHAKMTPQERYRIKVQEMSEGLVKSEHSEQEDESPALDEKTTVTVGKRRKRTSKTKRQEHHKKLYEQQLVKKELAKLKDINRIEEITGEVIKMEKTAEKKALKKSSKPPATESLPIDFIDPELLSGSLRTVQPLNNLIATGLPKVRKMSILKKTRAEAARKGSRPRKKVRYTRRSHKEANN